MRKNHLHILRRSFLILNSVTPYWIRSLKCKTRSKLYIIGAVILMIINSDKAVVRYVGQKATPLLIMVIISAIINIETVNSAIFSNIRCQTVFNLGANHVNTSRANNDWPPPKRTLRRLAPGPKASNKITPATIPQIYLRLNTAKWFNPSETRNWIAPDAKLKAAGPRHSTTYIAATRALIIHGRIFDCVIRLIPPSFFNVGWLRTT